MILNFKNTLASFVGVVGEPSREHDIKGVF